MVVLGWRAGVGSVERPSRALLASDGDQAADAAIELVSAVADRSTELRVVSVVPTGVPMVRHVQARAGPIEERHRRARTAAQTASEELRRAGFAVTSCSPEGRPAAAIARLAELEGADVVVIGATNHGRVGGLLGSISRAVVSHASTAVLVVREVVASLPTQVILAVDDLVRAAAAVDTAARLLDPARCRFIVVGVAEVLVPALSPPRIRHVAGSTDGYDDQESVIAARDHVEVAATRLRAHGFEVDERVVAGDPVRRIVAEVTDRGAGLVVLGGRGLGAVEGALLGSVSRAVLSRVPATLIVPG